jgi:hypothetical protein
MVFFARGKYQAMRGRSKATTIWAGKSIGREAILKNKLFRVSKMQNKLMSKPNQHL